MIGKRLKKSSLLRDLHTAGPGEPNKSRKRGGDIAGIENGDDATRTLAGNREGHSNPVIALGLNCAAL